VSVELHINFDNVQVVFLTVEPHGRAIHERSDGSPFIDGVTQWGGKNPLHFSSFNETKEVF
jgi:hypothetical protein